MVASLVFARYTSPIGRIIASLNLRTALSLNSTVSTIIMDGDGMGAVPAPDMGNGDDAAMPAAPEETSGDADAPAETM